MERLPLKRILKCAIWIPVFLMNSSCTTSNPLMEPLSAGAGSRSESSRDMANTKSTEKKVSPVFWQKQKNHSHRSDPSLKPVKHVQSDNKRFDVSAVNIPAQQFFMGLMKERNTNIVVHPDVEGTISISLQGVTLREVMQAVSDVYEYDHIRERYGYKILPRMIQSRLFKVDYLNVSRQGKSNTRVTSGQVSQPNGSNNTSSPETAGSNSQGDTSVRLVNSEVETKTHADFWKSMTESLRTIVGEGEGRRVVVSPQVGLVLVDAYASELHAVEQFLQRAEDALLKQVVIEAKILEVVLNEKFQAGIQWDTFEQGFGGQLELNDSRVGAGFQSGDISNLVDSALGGIFSIGLNFTDFSSIIQLLDSQGDVQVLSSPRISTVNNQKAVIKVGSEEYFVTNISNDTNQGTTSSTITTDVTISPFFSGIALDVTPHISNNDVITLHIHPTITTVTDKIKEVGLADSPLVLPLAFKTVRESDSIVKARHGQVIVLGGLIQNQEETNRADIPWLHKLPLIGLLFSQRQNVTKKSELVILLRPQIVNMNADYGDMSDIESLYSGQHRGKEIRSLQRVY